MKRYKAFIDYVERNVVGLFDECLGLSAESAEDAERRARAWAERRGEVRTLRVEEGW